MPLWGLTDASSNVVKTVAMGFNSGIGGTAIAANNTAMYGNVTPSSFGSPAHAQAIGVFGVSAAEMANTGGERNKVTHAGWNIRQAGLGPLASLAINAGGTGYANSDLVRVSGGAVNASATLTTNSTGGLATLTITNYGSGFVNTSATTVAVTNSTGGASLGSTATFTYTLGGRAGRVTYENIVAMGSMSNGATDNTYLPQ